MKWALIILYFIAGPEGGWYESTERKFFTNEKECIEHMEFFNNMPKPGVMMSRCHELGDEEWWNQTGHI